MTSVIPARRRAEEFAALVDDRGGAEAGRHAVLLALVADLRSAPAVSARPEFVTGLREQLMAEADVTLAKVDDRLALPPHTKARRDRRIAVAAGAVALVGATSSIAVAAQTALPGDALYPIKRALESAGTTLQADDTNRATSMLLNATGRLDEAFALARLSSTDSEAALPQTFDDFSHQAVAATDLVLADYAETGDTDVVTSLREFTATSMDRLAGLDPLVPDSAREALNHAAVVLTEIDQRASAVCPTCGGVPLQVPQALRLTSVMTDGVTPRIAPSVVLVPSAPDEKQSSGSDPLVQTDDDNVELVPPKLDEDKTSPSEPGDDDGKLDDSGGTLTDLTDQLVKSGGTKAGTGLLDPLVDDSLLDPVTGEDGLID